MNIYEMLVNRALNGGGSGGGGGGGSSDLSTCTMTVTGLNEGAYAEIQFPVIEDDSFFVGTMAAFEVPDGNFLLPLYKGKVAVFVVSEANYTVSGNAIDTGEGIIATGDFTIALTFT